jgi:hypothetical protein
MAVAAVEEEVAVLYLLTGTTHGQKVLNAIPVGHLAPGKIVARKR